MPEIFLSNQIFFYNISWSKHNSVIGMKLLAKLQAIDSNLWNKSS